VKSARSADLGSRFAQLVRAITPQISAAVPRFGGLLVGFCGGVVVVFLGFGVWGRGLGFFSSPS